MESLGLNYAEVVEQIPYRTLLMMQKDKLHLATGSIVREASGRSVAQRKMAKQQE